MKYEVRRFLFATITSPVVAVIYSLVYLALGDSMPSPDALVFVVVAYILGVTFAKQLVYLVSYILKGNN